MEYIKTIYAKPLKNIVRELKKRKLSREYDGEYSGFSPAYRRAEKGENIICYGVITDYGCILHIISAKSSTLGIYVYPALRQQGYATKLAQLFQIHINDKPYQRAFMNESASHAKTTMQQPTLDLMRCHVQWPAHCIDEYID